MSQKFMNTKKNSTISMGRIGNRPTWVLALSLIIRALHQVGAAVFLTAFLLDIDFSIIQVYAILTLVSGCALVVSEWMRHRQLYREVSGASNIMKLMLLGLGFHGFIPQTSSVILVFILAALTSHAPKTIRHRLLF